jgi:hypothetical protein
MESEITYADHIYWSFQYQVFFSILNFFHASSNISEAEEEVQCSTFSISRQCHMPGRFSLCQSTESSKSIHLSHKKTVLSGII